MKKLLLFAVVAGLGLVSASPPTKVHDPAPREARAYPPCSRTVTDRCNQLHRERGHGRQHAEHRGHREHHAHRGHASHRHHARHHAGRGGGHAMRAPAAAHRRVARVRRAGERG